MRLIASLLIITAGLTQAADKTGFDKATLEAYLRHVELWVPGVNVKIDDAKESTELPGFLDITVHLSYNNTTPPDLHYFMSKDGKKIFKGDVYDINKSPFQANIDKLDVKGAPTLGPANAPIAVVVFSDFQCPMCRQEAEVIHKQITEAFPTQVRVYFRDFPLESLHNWARPAAIAGRCVYKLNPAAFWDYHDWVYENQTYIGLDNLNSKLQEFAAAKGLDGMQLSRCIENKTTDPEVKASIAEGNSLSINSTPTLFVNGRRIDGAVPWENLQALLKAEIDHEAKAASALTTKDDSCCTVTIPKIVK
jgi:protein-disulfide isomerase